MKQPARLRLAALAAGLAVAGTSAAVMVSAGATDPPHAALPAACTAYLGTTTSIPATSIPATSIPATSIPATSIPATSIPATGGTGASTTLATVPASSSVPTSSAAPGSTMASTSTTSVTVFLQAMSVADVSFARFAVQAALDEIAAGTLAASQASDPAIRAFAQRMVAEHTAQLRQVQALAAALQLRVPSASSAQAQLALEDMKALRGTSFDRAYLSMQAHAHHELFNRFAMEAVQGDNDCAQGWASSYLPVIADHLRVAADLLIAAEAPPTSSTPTSSTPTSSTPTSSTPTSSTPTSRTTGSSVPSMVTITTS